MSFIGVCEKNQLEFELFWCVYGRDRRMEKKNRKERERGSGGMSRAGRGEIRGVCKMPFPLFFAPSWFIFDTASLIRNSYSKPKSII